MSKVHTSWLWPAVWRLVGGASLRLKIMGIALAMVCLLGLGITWQVRVTMADVLTRELQERGISIARGLALRSVDQILTNDLYGLYQLCRDTVRSNEDVRYVFFLDPQGRLLAHSFEDGFPLDLLSTAAAGGGGAQVLETLQTEEGLIQDVAMPVFEGRAGAVRVGMSYNRLEQTLSGMTRKLLLTTLLVSLAGVVISGVLTWLLARPVRALAEATRRVGEGDLSLRLLPWANDEIGHLQRSFNVMVERLARSRDEMEAYNRRLLQRNRELSALYAISRAVAGPLELAQVLERALQQTVAAVGASGGWVCMLDDDSSCAVYVGIGEDALRPAGGAECCRRCRACQQAWQARQPLVMRSLPAHCPLRAAERAAEGQRACHVVVPLIVKGENVGLLNVVLRKREGGQGRRDLALLEAIGRQLGVAMENARLWAEVRRKELLRRELLRRVISAQEEERKRIARELHDETGQALTSLLVTLRLMEQAATLSEAQALVARMQEVVGQTLDEIRNLALELRPAVLDDLGLMPALARYAQSCRSRFGLEVGFVSTGLDASFRLPLEVETTLYRIAQEALTNVARHAGATCASILLERRGRTAVLMVEDDGRGFEPMHSSAQTQPHGRLGLYGMEERASLIGGRLTVESRPGLGTTVLVEVPLEEIWGRDNKTGGSFVS